jgi:hypothetical protein
MDSQEGRRLAEPLARRVGAGADALQIADAVVTVWAEIDDALTPILGSQGVVALFKRSLHLAAGAHPWLTAERDDTPAWPDPTALRAALARQSASVAAAGGDAFLQSFLGLLAGLVGASLSDRLLRSVWSPSSSGPTAKDTCA